MLNKIIYIKDFLTKGIWSMSLSDFSPRKAMQIKALRVLVLSIRGIYEDKIQQRAAALTLYSLLSVVPVLALGFGIAKGFGFAKYLEDVLRNKLSEYKDIVENLITFANTMLAKTQGGLVAGVGFAMLIYTVMKVFMNVESSFNDIWQVKKGRPYVRKFSDYVSMMLISPVFLITASAVNVYLTDRLRSINQHVEVVNFISPVLFSILKIVPFFLIIVLFTLIYMIMPNTKVTLRAGLVGGVIAGSVFQIAQWLYIYFQIGVSNYNAIYGSFAAIPLFIIWLQVSWLIVLFGAKISYATQNYEMYEFETETIHMSDYSRRILSFLVTHQIIQNFKDGIKPQTAIELSQELHIPIRMLKLVLHDLVKCKIISEVLTDKPKITGFQPAQHIERFTIKSVMERLDRLGEHYSVIEHSEVTRKFVEIHDKFFKAIETLPENVLIKDL
jgi:membrane protein